MFVQVREKLANKETMEPEAIKEAVNDLQQSSLKVLIQPHSSFDPCFHGLKETPKQIIDFYGMMVDHLLLLFYYIQY